MKKIILSSYFLIILSNCLAQDIEYEVRGKQGRTIKLQVFDQPNLLSDIILDYPTNWIKDYVSVEITTEHEGIKEKAEGNNGTLNQDQKTILKKVELDTDIQISVSYKMINSVTDLLENNEMKVSMTVVPDTEAEFEGGYQELKKYLKENLIERFVVDKPEEFQKGKVAFCIDTNGKIVDATIDSSSGDTDLDNILLEIFRNMPNWKPAQLRNGQKVKQKFVFSMGIGGC